MRRRRIHGDNIVSLQYGITFIVLIIAGFKVYYSYVIMFYK